MIQQHRGIAHQIDERHTIDVDRNGIVAAMRIGRDIRIAKEGLKLISGKVSVIVSLDKWRMVTPIAGT